MSYDSRYDCPQTYLKPYWGFYEFAAAVLELCENPSWQQAWRSKVHFNDVQLWIFKWVVAWINFEIVIFICHYYILYLQKKKSARVMYKYLLSKRIKWFGTNLTPLAICWLCSLSIVRCCQWKGSTILCIQTRQYFPQRGFWRTECLSCEENVDHQGQFSTLHSRHGQVLP